MAESLIGEIDDMIDRLKQAQDRYDELHPKVAAIVDLYKQEIEE